MKYPDFLVVGAARAGTTSLYYYLRQHPSLFLPKIKEPSFFTFANEKPVYTHGKFSFAINDQEKYFKLFDLAQASQVCGEISTPYLYLYEKTIANIRMYHPNSDKLKIIIVLRNPVDRAFSQYMWRVRDGREELSFEEALEKEEQRREEGYSFDYFYKDRGFYYPQVKAYLEKFKAVKIVLFEEMVEDTTAALRSLCRFLGVDDEHVFQLEESRNSSYVPRWNFLGRMVTMESSLKFRLLNQFPDSFRKGIRQQFDKWNKHTGKSLTLSPQTRKNLQSEYRDDILQLQQLIGRDLSAWLKIRDE